MKIKIFFLIAILGVMAGVASVYIYKTDNTKKDPLVVHYNPYQNGIYATGILETRQDQASNIQMYPTVSGRVTDVYFKDGEKVKKNDVLLKIYQDVQEKKLEKDAAQVALEKATLKNLKEQLDKLKKSYQLDPKSVSRNQLDNAQNAVLVEEEALHVAEAQHNLDQALLGEYTMRSPIDGVVLRVAAASGAYISTQGVYDPYTQALIPVIQLGQDADELQVRCFVDELLVTHLPDPKDMEATLFVRGDKKSIPLEFVNMQPYTIPNIQLSNEKAVRVDVRVLPIIFKFKKPKQFLIFPGQMVDVYIKKSEKKNDVH